MPPIKTKARSKASKKAKGKTAKAQTPRAVKVTDRESGQNFIIAALMAGGSLEKVRRGIQAGVTSKGTEWTLGKPIDELTMHDFSYSAKRVERRIEQGQMKQSSRIYAWLEGKSKPVPLAGLKGRGELSAVTKVGVKKSAK